MQQTCPKVLLVTAGDPTLALRGFSQFGWLKRLKNSVRNCSLTRSVTLKSLLMPESIFQITGPRKALRPVLPYAPAAGMQNAAPFSTCVQLVLASKVFPAGLKDTGPLMVGLVTLYLMSAVLGRGPRRSA